MARRRSAECDDNRTRESSEERDKTEEGKRYPREEKRAETETEVTRTTRLRSYNLRLKDTFLKKKWSTMSPTFSAIAGL